jgi:hypothetical protein
LFGHSGAEHFQHILNSNSHPSNTGASPALCWAGSYAIQIARIHCHKMSLHACEVNRQHSAYLAHLDGPLGFNIVWNNRHKPSPNR